MVRTIGTCHLDKLLQVISELSCLVLAIVLGNGDELLIGVTNLLAIVSLVTSGYDRDSLGLSLWSPLVALGFLVSCLRGRPSTTIEDRFPTALYENGPDHLLTRGVPDGDVEELLHRLWLIAAELMHQGSPVCAGPEHRDDVSVVHLGELVTLFGETPDVVPWGLALFLRTILQVPGITASYVRALKVTGKNLLKILPTIDRVSG
jgi:hypothetical protein